LTNTEQALQEEIQLAMKLRSSNEKKRRNKEIELRKWVNFVATPNSSYGTSCI
jgi:hypothetical protein